MLVPAAERETAFFVGGGGIVLILRATRKNKMPFLKWLKNFGELSLSP